MTGEAGGGPDTAGTDSLVAKFGEKRCDGNLRYRRRPDWYHNCDLPLGHDGMHLERCWFHDDSAGVKVPIVTQWGAWQSAEESWPSDQESSGGTDRQVAATGAAGDSPDTTGNVRWSGTPRPDTPDWSDKNPTGTCQSCGRATTLRPDPIVGQKVCRPCWEGMMFDD